MTTGAFLGPLDLIVTVWALIWLLLMALLALVQTRYLALYQMFVDPSPNEHEIYGPSNPLNMDFFRTMKALRTPQDDPYVEKRRKHVSYVVRVMVIYMVVSVPALFLIGVFLDSRVE